jgi:hypothetical protein
MLGWEVRVRLVRIHPYVVFRLVGVALVGGVWFRRRGAMCWM